MHKNPVAPRSQRPELLLQLFPSVPSSPLTLRLPPWTPSLLPTLFPLHSHFVPPSSPSVLTSWGRLSAQQDGEGTWGCIRMHAWCLAWCLACCIQYVTLSSFGLYEIWFACCVVFIYFQFFSQSFSHFLASEHFFLFSVRPDCFLQGCWRRAETQRKIEIPPRPWVTQFHFSLQMKKSALLLFSLPALNGFHCKSSSHWLNKCCCLDDFFPLSLAVLQHLVIVSVFKTTPENKLV